MSPFFHGLQVSKDASLSWASALKSRQPDVLWESSTSYRLAGEAVDVEDAEYRKPLDLVRHTPADASAPRAHPRAQCALSSPLALSGRQLARDRWHLSEAESGAESAGERATSNAARAGLSFVLCLVVSFVVV